LLEDPALASRVAANALRACEKYSWSFVRGEWLELYHELARESERARSDTKAEARP
jgi:hypothetical protein